MKKILNLFSSLPPIIKQAAAIINSLHAGVEAFQSTWNIHFPPKVEEVLDTAVDVVNKVESFVEKDINTNINAK